MKKIQKGVILHHLWIWVEGVIMHPYGVITHLQIVLIYSLYIESVFLHLAIF